MGHYHGVLPKLITEVPGPKSLQLSKKLQSYESQNVTYLSPHFPIFWDRAEGCNIWDVDGNCYLDLTSGFGVSTMGWGDQALVKCMQMQAGLLYHAMGDVHPCPAKAELCELLSEITYERWGLGKGKSILGNSGFEAVEAAMKTAWLVTGKRRIIAFESGYHGLGYGAMTVTGRREFHEPFKKQLADIASFVPFPHYLDAGDNWKEPFVFQLEELLANQDYGAILVEPIQGRGGEVVPPKGFLRLLRDISEQYGVLLIFDEIYTGFYRTGDFFACEAEGVYPDLVCLGKALSGGFPISACVGKEEIMDYWPKSTGEALHTSTFLGHPIGCAMAVESIHYWKKKSTQKWVGQLSKIWYEALYRLVQEHTCLARLRGRGLMWGLEIADGNGKVASQRTEFLVLESLRCGMVLLAGGVDGNILSLTPNLALENNEMVWTIDSLRDVLTLAEEL
ncbi:MAG: aspartate aminotransferase family protein [Verrucomicrobiota bacterium]